MVFKHKGYTLVQEEEINHHYMIIDEDDRLCLHAAYNGALLTEEQAQEIIENYLSLIHSYEGESNGHE